METKYFGEYLVDKGLISEGDLVGALIDQVNALPSVVQIIFEKNLMSKSDILRVIKVQNQKGIEFIQAARDCSLWNQNLQVAIIKEIEKLRIPLGQILVNSKKVALMDLSTALDDFLSKIQSVPGLTDVQSESDLSAVPKKIDEFLLDEIEFFMSDERLKILLTQFSGLKEKPSSINHFSMEEINFIIGDHVVCFLTLKGLFRNAKLFKSEILVKELLDAASIVKSEIINQNVLGIFSYAEKGAQFLAKYKGLMASLRGGATEEQWFGAQMETNK